MDRIVITGIEFYGKHGLYKEENILGAKFIVDIEAYLNFGSVEQIEDTLNYEIFEQIVREEGSEKTYKLIEKLANSIAERIIDYPQLSKVVVRVHKPHAALKFIFKDLFVETTRERK